MPILLVKISAQKTPEMSKAVGNTLLELTSRILGKKPEVTSIVIDYVDPHDWIVGGRSLVEHGQSSVYFDAKVTDETNTKAEKAQYIHESFEAFSRLLGNLHHESYVYVQDVRAAAYGYGGKTQEYRFQQIG